MIPYRPSQTKQKLPKDTKLKPIPSLQLINTLNILCEGTNNSYDSKNHILTINNLKNFENQVQNKLNRTLKSFERQLKLLGFKLRKYKFNQDQNEQDMSNQMRVYKWKGKKQQLIDQQLSYIQKSLKERRGNMQQARQIIRNGRKIIDSQIESLIFSIIVNPQSEKVKENINSIINKTKSVINESELSVRKIINKISATLGNQLELYKLLIYKQGNSEKRINQKQQEGEAGNENNQSEEIEGQQPIEQEEDSKKSVVSIEVDKTVKEQIEKQNKENEGNFK